jgi:rhodanese-related sulfurtransferase
MTEDVHTSAAELLDQARAGLERLSPEDADLATRAGALLLDIRSEVQRERDGVIPGSRFIPRNAFEWRCDPSSEWSDPEVARRPGRRLIVICDEGFQSSLAAATLQRLGFADASDVIGGFQAWRGAGLQVAQAPARS